MPDSVVILASSQSADAVAPGAGSFGTIFQRNNATWDVQSFQPTADSDSSALTGLTHRNLATAVRNPDGTSPFDGLSGAAIRASGALIVTASLDASAPGSEGHDDIAVLNLGGVQSFALWWDDNL